MFPSLICLPAPTQALGLVLGAQGRDRGRPRPHGHLESRSGPHGSAEGSASPQRG